MFYNIFFNIAEIKKGAPSGPPSSGFGESPRKFEAKAPEPLAWLRSLPLFAEGLGMKSNGNSYCVKVEASIHSNGAYVEFFTYVS